jgi:hypothetical protein
VVEFKFVWNWGVRCQSPCHAPSVRGAIVLRIYVVLDCGQLVAWSVVSGGIYIPACSSEQSPSLRP